jgi:hypothetical protein
VSVRRPSDTHRTPLSATTTHQIGDSPRQQETLSTKGLSSDTRSFWWWAILESNQWRLHCECRSGRFATPPFAHQNSGFSMWRLGYRRIASSL